MHKFGHFVVLSAMFMGVMAYGTPSSFAAASKNKHEIDKDLAVVFTKFDKNHDKFLDKPEITLAATAAFTLRDANKDGVLDKTERKSWLTKKIVDENGGKDGKLPKKEFMTLAMARFDAADRETRGKVSLEEFAGWRMGKSLAKLINPPPLKAK